MLQVLLRWIITPHLRKFAMFYWFSGSGGTPCEDSREDPHGPNNKSRTYEKGRSLPHPFPPLELGRNNQSQNESRIDIQRELRKLSTAKMGGFALISRTPG
jgi:hypothetical protein